jgi:crotonobetainyl-CoA:carnitine CoA-transferase CaiB-like acyl-CoA transferase
VVPHRLLRTADVLVENFAPGVMERLGLGYEDHLRKENPALIYCSLSGFGRTGPYRHRRGFDLIARCAGCVRKIPGNAPRSPSIAGRTRYSLQSQAALLKLRRPTRRR